VVPHPLRPTSTTKPGFHGEPSPLDRLDDGDLTTTVDFRFV